MTINFDALGGVRESFYPATNESLEGIVGGMNIGPNDRVLSVLGSGDQAFAMLEVAEFVRAVDVNPLQVDLTRARRDHLLREDYEGFLHEGLDEGTMGGEYVEERNKYFLEEGRLDRIRKRIGRLQISKGDIYSEVGQDFNKVYLSNIENFDMSGENLLVMANRLGLANDALIYLANAYYTTPRTNEGKRIIKETSKIENSQIVGDVGIILDADCTSVARNTKRRMGMWSPGVYRVLRRKVA